MSRQGPSTSLLLTALAKLVRSAWPCSLGHHTSSHYSAWQAIVLLAELPVCARQPACSNGNIHCERCP